MSKDADPPQQHPVGQSNVEVMPSTTGGASELDKAVIATKKASIAIIVIQLIALAAYGWFFLSQILLTLLVLIVSISVLCTRNFNEFGYIVTAVVYCLGVVGDVWRVIEWFLFVEFITDSSADYDSQYDSADDEVWWVYVFALPSVLGAVMFLVGAVFALKAIGKWQQSGTLPV